MDRDKRKPYSMFGEAKPFGSFFDKRDAQKTNDEPNKLSAGRYCPYCGAELARDFSYCGDCGRHVR